MKILYISHSVSVSDGSVIALGFIVRSLRNQGYDARVVFPKSGGMQQALSDEGVVTYVLRYEDAIYPICHRFKSYLFSPYVLIRTIIRNNKACRKLKQIISDYRPDIVHTNVGTIRVGFAPARAMKVPHVWHIREIGPTFELNHFPSHNYQRKLLLQNDYNIVITKAVYNYYNLLSRNSKVIYDGVFHKSTLPNINWEKKPYFLFVGRLVNAKGGDWAVKSFLNIALNYKDIELWIAGEGSGQYAEDLHRIVSDSEFGHRVKFLGYRKDIYALMSKALALLVPSEKEGFGFITAEAMYNGCLVIGRDTYGTKEQMDNGLEYTGHEIALRFTTIEELSKRLCEVCDNGTDYYRDMIESAQSVVLSKYTIEQNIENIINVYNRLSNG